MHFAHQFWLDKPREVNTDGRRAQETEEGDEAVSVWAMACISHGVGAPMTALL